MVKRGAVALVTIVTIVLLLSVLPATAQSGALVAFINGSGQLVISDGDSGYRWVVTNPGEVLNNTLGFNWSPDGSRLFYAVGSGEVSLRVASTSNQGLIEIGRVSGSLSGGQWTPNGASVVVGVDGSVLSLAADGSGAQELAGGQGSVYVPSPSSATVTTQQPSSVSPDGSSLFFWRGDGRYAIQSGSGAFISPGTNDATATNSGLWSNAAPLVAYWGFSGNSILSVTNALSGETVTLDSGRSAPINPVAWVTNSTRLIYRDGSNTVKITDLSCLQGGCGTNPLESGVDLLPATASDIRYANNWVYFVDGGQVKAVRPDCATGGGCLGQAVVLGSNVAPRSSFDVGGSRLVYTAFAQDSSNPADREVRLVDTSCLATGDCQFPTLQTGAVAGRMSADGTYVLTESVSGGLSSLRTTDGQLTFLSDGAGLLSTVQWN